MRIIDRPSPNHGERRCGPTDILLLHYTGMATADAAADWLCDPRSGVSAHYLIDEDGTVFSLVAEARRAWHAGIASWKGESDINSRSIGVEIQNCGHPGGLPAFADKQIQSVIELTTGIVARHSIAPSRVLAHSDVAPGRKIDPGERFPWAILARAGIGLWREPDPPDETGVLECGAEGDLVVVLQKELAAFGYGLDVTGDFDPATETVVAAFQRHWRPARVDGRADTSTRDQLVQLAALARAG